MNDAPLGGRFALELTRRHVRSARPEAPVVPDRGTRRRRRSQRLR